MHKILEEKLMISGLLNGLLALTFVGNMSAPFCANVTC